MVLITAAQINHFDKQAGLRGYPKSEQWFIGIDLFLEQRFDVAAEAFHQGARIDSCVACMFYYAEVQRNHNQACHLALPWTLEGALRGHIHCMKLLVVVYYNQNKLPESQQVEAEALRKYWIQMMVEFSEERKEEKTEDGKSSSCSSCCKHKELEDININNNNSHDGDENKNESCDIVIGGEWKHLDLLRNYNKPHDAIEIRKAILRGEDPKDLQTLQTVRTKVGLNRPEEDYQESLLVLANDSQSQCRNRYLMARTDGTVHIGSTPQLV